ncbi:MAG TPA: DNA-directed RNA polymerase subunit beta, partial [bacterium]|nr:DNA-directed RNA polymerase subunit beta [bacterium]
MEAQLDSYRAFLQEGVSPDKRRQDRGLESVFHKIFPLSNNEGTLRLEYSHYLLETPPYTPEECKEKGLTWGSALRVCLRLVKLQKGTGELVQVKEAKEVFLGTIPLMTERCTFVINRGERVIISRLQRSLGVYFKEDNPSPRDYS